MRAFKRRPKGPGKVRWRLRWRRWARRLVGLVPAAGVAALVVLYLVVEHIPGWYRPVVLTETDARRVRAEVTNFVDTVSDRIVASETFEIVLRARVLNDWLAALPRLWPDLSRELPPGLSAPAVQFDPDVPALRVGAEYTRGAWRAILSVSLSPALSEDGSAATIKVNSVRVGSLPVPRALLARWVNPEDWLGAYPGGTHGWRAALAELESVDALFAGITVRNRFVWPNGKRPFRLAGLEVEDGQVRLRLEPL